MGTGTVIDAAVDREIRDLIYRACLLLDQRNFLGWLELCAPTFRYTISAYSPEIRKEMIWLDHDLEGMVNMIRVLPRHNSDQSLLTRHASVYQIAHDPTANQAEAVTSVLIFRTELDGGATSLFAVGKYHDIILLGPGGPRFAKRELRLDTRDLGIGTHFPL